MNRDHLRLVTANSEPCVVTQMETFSFAQIDGGMIILHGDRRISPAEALVAITTLLKPALAGRSTYHDGTHRPQHRLPGDLGGDGLETIADEIDGGTA